MLHTKIVSHNANGSIHSHPTFRLTAVHAGHNASVKRHADVFTGCVGHENVKQVNVKITPSPFHHGSSK